MIRQQAFNAERHILQAAGGIQARADDLEQRPYARQAMTGADALQTLLHQQPVIAVKRHHVGHRSHGNQVQQLPQVRFG